MAVATLTNAEFQGNIDIKVQINAQGVAGAPKLKSAKFATKGDSQLAKVQTFIRNSLKLKPSDSLYLFVKNSFQPPMDARIKDLYENFGQ